MLFSELNRINLNILIGNDNIQKELESLPNLDDIYIHNKSDWTIFYHPENVTDLNDLEPEENGWKLHPLLEDNLEDAYLNSALNDISNSQIEISADNSDLIKIYAGPFDYDGTLNFSDLNKCIDVFSPKCKDPFKPAYHQCNFGDWWTFSNGAFQWIGGVKSIGECRYSYGPFTECGCDPHHFIDTNQQTLQKVVKYSIIPNIIFIFDALHVLHGIISLPCINSEQKQVNQNFIENLIAFAKTTQSKISFKNFDNILKEFSKTYAFLPTIKIIQPLPPIKLEDSINAVFEVPLESMNVINPDKFKYIFLDKNTISTFLENSIWKNYSIEKSLHLSGEHTEVSAPPYSDLSAQSTISNIIDHVNVLQDIIDQIYNRIETKVIYSKLTENYMHAPGKDSSKYVAIMTLSDLFKQARYINKTYDKDKNDIIILPEGFCDKNTLQVITNVKYP